MTTEYLYNPKTRRIFISNPMLAKKAGLEPYYGAVNDDMIAPEGHVNVEPGKKESSQPNQEISEYKVADIIEIGDAPSKQLDEPDKKHKELIDHIVKSILLLKEDEYNLTDGKPKVNELTKVAKLIVTPSLRDEAWAIICASENKK